MRSILFIFISMAILSCNKKDEPEPKDPQKVELYYYQEIPSGGKLYINDITLTTKDFVGATTDAERFDYPNKYISSTNKYDGSTLNTNLEDGIIAAATSLRLYLNKYSSDNGINNAYILDGTTIVHGKPVKVIITNPKGLNIKTENYPVKITVIE